MNQCIPLTRDTVLATTLNVESPKVESFGLGVGRGWVITEQAVLETVHDVRVERLARVARHSSS